MLSITIKGTLYSLPENITPVDALSQAHALLPGTLAVTLDNHTLNLTDPLTADGTLTPITFADEEGRRIYERSLRFVMLAAVRALWPGQRVRIEYSAGSGVLVHLPGRPMSAAMLDALRAKMHELINSNLPFERSTWTREEAIAYFAQDGQQDKVDLLHYRRQPFFTVYSCAGMWEYFYGPMVPSTGYVSVFDMTRQDNGFILLLPRTAKPTQPAPVVDRPKHMAIFAQSARWCDILGVQNVADLDRLAEEGGLRAFIRVNEVLHDQAMSDIAREIVAKDRRVILVAGPSSSGKTTFAGRMCVHLRVLGRRCVRISLDDYYLDRDQIPPEADGSIDLEAITTLDLPLIQAHVRALLAGETVQIPRFNFKLGRRDGSKPLYLGPDDMVVFEGIHALNPMLSEGMPHEAIHRIFVSALTCLNLDDHNRIRTTDVRLLRRIVRDNQFRGTLPQETMKMWPSVRRGEETWIFPYQELADSMFNTALHYELPILRHFVYDLVCAVPATAPEYRLASRLRKILNYIPDIDERVLAEVPPLSLLREFIGGNTIDE